MAGGPVASRLPNEAEVDLARRSGATYGTPTDGYTRPGARMHTTADNREAIRTVNMGIGKGSLADAPQRTVDTPHADHMLRSWLAAQQSPLAALGFDPARMVQHTVAGQAPMPDAAMSPEAPLPPPRPPEFGPGGNSAEPQLEMREGAKNGFNLGGVYVPADDMMWTDGNRTTPLHESMHRGMKMLRDAGKLPDGVREEDAVRAIMDQTYGGAERGRGDLGDKQIDGALKHYGQRDRAGILKMLEAAAAQLIAQRQPRGPR